jgi:hypothetical protein
MINMTSWTVGNKKLAWPETIWHDEQTNWTWLTWEKSTTILSRFWLNWMINMTSWTVGNKKLVWPETIWHDEQTNWTWPAQCVWMCASAYMWMSGERERGLRDGLTTVRDREVVASEERQNFTSHPIWCCCLPFFSNKCLLYNLVQKWNNPNLGILTI